MADRGGIPDLKLTPTETHKVGEGFPEEWIAVAAYYIWEKDGKPNGHDRDHWNRARAQLGERSAGNLADLR